RMLAQTSWLRGDRSRFDPRRCQGEEVKMMGQCSFGHVLRFPNYLSTWRLIEHWSRSSAHQGGRAITNSDLYRADGTHQIRKLRFQSHKFQRLANARCAE